LKKLEMQENELSLEDEPPDYQKTVRPPPLLPQDSTRSLIDQISADEGIQFNSSDEDEGNASPRQMRALLAEIEAELNTKENNRKNKGQDLYKELSSRYTLRMDLNKLLKKIRSEVKENEDRICEIEESLDMGTSMPQERKESSPRRRSRSPSIEDDQGFFDPPALEVKGNNLAKEKWPVAREPAKGPPRAGETWAPASRRNLRAPASRRNLRSSKGSKQGFKEPDKRERRGTFAAPSQEALRESPRKQQRHKTRDREALKKKAAALLRRKGGPTVIDKGGNWKRKESIPRTSPKRTSPKRTSPKRTSPKRTSPRRAAARKDRSRSPRKTKAPSIDIDLDGAYPDPPRKKKIVFSLPIPNAKEKGPSQHVVASTTVRKLFHKEGLRDEFQCVFTDDSGKKSKRGEPSPSPRKAKQRQDQKWRELQDTLREVKRIGGCLLMFMEGYTFHLDKQQQRTLDFAAKLDMLSTTRCVVWDSQRKPDKQMLELWEKKASPDTFGYPMMFFLKAGRWEGVSSLQSRIETFFKTTDWHSGDIVKAKHQKLRGFHNATIKKVHRAGKKFDLEFHDKDKLQKKYGRNAWRREKCPREEIAVRKINPLVGLATGYPLEFASSHNFPLTIKCIISWTNMDVNLPDSDMNTPLHTCSSVECLRVLLDADGDVNQRGAAGFTVLQSAAFQGRIGILKFLLQQAGEEKLVLEGTADSLRLAAKNNQLSVVVELLDHPGVNIDAADTGQRTSLIFAAREGHIEVVKYLLEKNAAVNHPDKYGQTPLVWASAEGKPDVVSILLEASADIEAEDNDGQTPLIWASSEGRSQVVEILLEYNANIKCIDAEFGRTPLMRAVMENHTETMIMLVEYNAKLETSDNDGRTAFMLASEFANERTVLALLELNADIEARDKEGNSALVLACKRGALDAVQMLLRAGSDLSAEDKYGWTSLMWAAKRGHVSIVDYLISCSADVNATCRGWTVLMRAAAEGHSKIVVKLINAKADIDARDRSESRTALMKAARAGHLDTVTCLLLAGADAKLLDDNKDTAFSLSKLRNHHSVSRVLEEFQFGKGVLPRENLEQTSRLFTRDFVEDWAQFQKNSIDRSVTPRREQSYSANEPQDE